MERTYFMTLAFTFILLLKVVCNLFKLIDQNKKNTNKITINKSIISTLRDLSFKMLGILVNSKLSSPRFLVQLGAPYKGLPLIAVVALSCFVLRTIILEWSCYDITGVIWCTRSVNPTKKGQTATALQMKRHQRGAKHYCTE